MVNFPPPHKIATIFYVDCSELNTRGYGFMTCFCTIGLTPEFIDQTNSDQPFKFLEHKMLISARTNAAMRPHVFKSLDTATSTSIIGSILFCHPNDAQ
jgi:hypothetical protein